MAKKANKASNPLGIMLPMMQPPQQLREMAAKAVMEELGGFLARLNSPDSGRILESSLQLLPDEVFKTMAYLIIGNETDDVARSMVYELACKIAQKIGYEFDSIEPISDAANNILVLVNDENLRRKGHLDYLAPDNIFTSTPKVPGYNRLTNDGKAVYYKNILESNTTPPKYVM